MKSPSLSRDLIPVDELVRELPERLSRIRFSGSPLVLTQRGRAVAVLMTPQMYDALEDERALVRRVLVSLREAAVDEMVEDEQVWAEVESIIARSEKHP